MSQKVANSPLGSFVVAADTVDDEKFQRVKLDYGADGESQAVDATHPLPVTATFSGTVSPAAKVSAVMVQDIVNVATSTTPVLAANPARAGGWIKNISDTDVYVSLSNAAMTSKPSLIPPGGLLNLAGDGWVYTGDVAAIHAGTGNKDVEVVEL